MRVLTRVPKLGAWQTVIHVLKTDAIFNGCMRSCQNYKWLSPTVRHFHSHRPCLSEKKPVTTEMALQLRARIRMNGPISVAEYMREVLTNPVAGYYMHRDVFGTKGDFITSPEISQMFGELIGIWCVHEWMECGSPPELQVVELGPGRGTLADDMLRVFSQFKDIRDAVSMHMVEVSPTLSGMQAQKLSESGTVTELDASHSVPYHSCKSKYGPMVHWYQQLADVPRKFSFFVAHEFFDALPIHKFQKDSGGWREILVDNDDLSQDESKLLRFVISASPTAASRLLLQDALAPGDKRDHVELCPEGGVLAQELANRVAIDGGFALIADYGHLGTKADTFRAFQSHKLVDPLLSPGTADLTADVDFAYLQRLIEDRCSVHGPVTQELFLNNMGISYRLQALMSDASPDQRKDLISGYDMLTNPHKMGERFKFMALSRQRSGNYAPAGFKPPS